LTAAPLHNVFHGGFACLSVWAPALLLAWFAGLTHASADNLEGNASIVAPLADRSLLVDIGSARDTVVAVGERGHILVEDGKGKWRQSQVPTRTMLTGVHLQDALTGWAVGHDAVILRTSDGGKTWEAVYSDPELESPLLDVWFADERHGFAVGAYSLFLETWDGGTSWRARAFEPVADAGDGGFDASADIDSDDFSDVYDFHLNSLVPGQDGTLYIAAEGGNLYRSGDGGATWREMSSPYHGSFFGLLPLGNGTLLAFGLRGHLYRSGDEGATWQTIETGVKEMLTDGVLLEDGGIVIVGLGGTVLRSNDGGRRFELTRLRDRHGLSAIVQTGNGRLLAVGEGGVVDLAPAAER